MADQVVLNPGSGGSPIQTQTITATSKEMPVCKIHTGAVNVDGGTVTTTNPFPIAEYPTTTGGLSVARSLDLQNTGAIVKASAGKLYAFQVYNANAAARYLKFYNKATAGIPGTDTPVLTIALPPAALTQFNSPLGIPFATGISVGAFAGVADANNTGTTANDIVANIYFL